jgi:hypothetical protein
MCEVTGDAQVPYGAEMGTVDAATSGFGTGWSSGTPGSRKKTVLRIEHEHRHDEHEDRRRREHQD